MNESETENARLSGALRGMDEQANARLFDALRGMDEETNARLRARLIAAAERDGVLDVAYRTIATPVGELLLATTGRGLVRVAYPNQGHDAVLASLAQTVSPRILRAPARLDQASRQFDEYFTGQRTAFDLPLDLRLATGFRRTVLGHLPAIPYGHTESYAEVATAAGSPKAFRAVGTACAKNPLPVVVPCHRVVKSDGTMGRYAGGEDAKRALLTLESAV
jgi:methylated-DNA-[protein]-cysteine S-methyltransferase